MSMQSRKVQEHLARLKRLGVLLPEDRNPLQLWILVVMHPGDDHSGEFFVSHGKNYEKFAKRKGFEVIGHGHDRMALTEAARKLTKTMGDNYLPAFSAARKAGVTPPVSTEEPGASSPATVDVADDLDLDI